jgi:hypothetical protein
VDNCLFYDTYSCQWLGLVLLNGPYRVVSPTLLRMESGPGSRTLCSQEYCLMEAPSNLDLTYCLFKGICYVVLAVLCQERGSAVCGGGLRHRNQSTGSRWRGYRIWEQRVKQAAENIHSQTCQQFCLIGASVQKVLTLSYPWQMTA